MSGAVGDSPGGRPRGGSAMLLPAIAPDRMPPPRPGQGMGAGGGAQYGIDDDNRMYPYGNPFHDIGSSKIAQLEGRMEMTERANRALLEETVRLQGEVKQKTRKNDDGLKDEIGERLRLANTLRAVSETGQRMGSRMAKLEDVVNVDNKSLSAFIKYVKQMEKNHMSELQDLKHERNQDAQRIQALRTELEGNMERAGRSREQSDQRLLFVMEEIRQLKSKAEIQLNEFRESASDFRQRSQHLAQEQLAATEAIKSLHDSQAMAEAGNSALRVDFDTKMRQMEQEMVDLQQRLGMEENMRRKVEEEAKRIITDFNKTIVDHERNTRDSLSAIANALGEVREAGAKGQAKVIEKVQELVEAHHQKNLDSQSFMKAEMDARFVAVEQTVASESANRSSFEESSRDEARSRWKALETRLQEDVGQVKNGVKMEQMHTSETFTKLNEQMALMDRQSHSQRRTIEQTLRSEIKQRLKEENKAASSMEMLLNKIEGVRSHLIKHEAETDRLLQEHREVLGLNIKTKVEDAQQESMRSYADGQMQLAQVQRKLDAMKEQMSREQAETRKTTQTLHTDTKETLTKYQDLSQQQFEAVETKLNTIPHQVSKTDERLSIIKSDLETKIQSEVTKRLREVQVFRAEVDRKVNDGDYTKTIAILKTKVDEMNHRMTDHAMKISHGEHEVAVVRKSFTKTLHTEANTRMEAVMDLKREFVKLQTQNDFLLKQRDYKDRDADAINLAGLDTRTEQPPADEFWKVLESTQLLGAKPDGEAAVAGSSAGDTAPEAPADGDQESKGDDDQEGKSDAALLANFMDGDGAAADGATSEAGVGGVKSDTGSKKAKKKKSKRGKPRGTPPGDDPEAVAELLEGETLEEAARAPVPEVPDDAGDLGVEPAALPPGSVAGDAAGDAAGDDGATTPGPGKHTDTEPKSLGGVDATEASAGDVSNENASVREMANAGDGPAMAAAEIGNHDDPSAAEVTPDVEADDVPEADVVDQTNFYKPKFDTQEAPEAD